MRTDEQKYAAVLKELGDVLASKNTTILCNEILIKELEEKLAAAEQQIVEMAAEREAMAAEYEAKLKGGAA